MQCDQARPHCSQCIRANRSCPGYRDHLSLLFRDQSQDVIRKATAVTATESRKTKKTRAQGPARTGFPSGSSESLANGTVTLMDTNFSSNECRQQGLFQLTKQATRSLSPSMLRPNPTTNEAVSFLIHSGLLRHFSWTREDEIRLGAPQGSPSHQAMMASMAAVGMAMLSSVRKSSTMKVTAAREFGSALTLVNTALSDKVQAKSHFTLAAVLLLSIFEVRGEILLAICVRKLTYGILDCYVKEAGRSRCLDQSCLWRSGVARIERSRPISG